MTTRYYIKTITPDGRLVDIDSYSEQSRNGFSTYSDAVDFLELYDIHGAIVLNVVER